MHSREKLYKVIILGDSGVGKTSLMNQYVKDEYSQKYKATIGSDFMAKKLQLDEKTVVLQIWDTSGQEKFKSLGSSFYRGSDCCILVYDCTQPKTFESLGRWRDEFLLQGEPKDPETFPFVILGNKSDLNNLQKITEIQVSNWCQNHGNAQHFYTSAKNNLNVENAFQYIAKAAADRTIEDDTYFPPSARLSHQQLNRQHLKKQKSFRKCC